MAIRHRLNLSLTREELTTLHRVKTLRGLSGVSLCQFVKGLAMALVHRLDCDASESEDDSIERMFAEYESEEEFDYEKKTRR